MIRAETMCHFWFLHYSPWNYTILFIILFSIPLSSFLLFLFLSLTLSCNILKTYVDLSFPVISLPFCFLSVFLFLVCFYFYLLSFYLPCWSHTPKLHPLINQEAMVLWAYKSLFFPPFPFLLLCFSSSFTSSIYSSSTPSIFHRFHFSDNSHPLHLFPLLLLFLHIFSYSSARFSFIFSLYYSPSSLSFLSLSLLHFRFMCLAMRRKAGKQPGRAGVCESRWDWVGGKGCETRGWVGEKLTTQSLN